MEQASEAPASHGHEEIDPTVPVAPILKRAPATETVAVTHRSSIV